MCHDFSAPRAIVFDLDDTLFPEKDYVFSGFAAAAKHLAELAGVRESASAFAEEIAARMRHLFEAGARGDIFNRIVAETPGIPLPSSDVVPRMVEAYRAHTPALTLAPEVAALLRYLRERGHKTGVITDGWLDVQRRKVAALGLEPLVDAVLYSDTWGRAAWKPAIRPFRAMEAALGVAPDQCLYIGDNPAKDFIGARNAGWFSLRLRIPDREHSRAPAEPPFAPDFQSDSWPSLAQMLTTAHICAC